MNSSFAVITMCSNVKNAKKCKFVYLKSQSDGFYDESIPYKIMDELKQILGQKKMRK